MVSDGKLYGDDLNGAYFVKDVQTEDYVQIGSLDAVITTEVFNVTIKANGGPVNGQS